VVNARLLTTGSQNESYGGIDGGESESIDPERIEGDELETDEKSGE